MKIHTIKLGLLKELSLHKAKLFIQFLGHDKTIVLDSLKSSDFVKALVLMNDESTLVKIDGIEQIWPTKQIDDSLKEQYKMTEVVIL